MINKILEIFKKNPKISDIHLRGGTDIAYRAMGDIIIDKNSKVENKDVEELLKKNCSESEIQIFNAKKELDCAVTLGELRFRANFYKTLTGTAAVFRKIETKIPSMDSLGLPNVLYELVDAHKGLVQIGRASCRERV